jgi:uncharacterized DUF497 family protein
MYTGVVLFEWDSHKAAASVRKRGVQFSEASGVFDGDYAITIRDDESDPDEQRFATLGAGIKGRMLQRRKHSNRFRSHGGAVRAPTVRGTTMKDTYDFSKGKQGRVLAEPPSEPEKVRITIRLDEDLIDYFGAMADRSGGKVGYQTLINSALREYVEGKTPKWEETLRRIIREEMSHNSAA